MLHLGTKHEVETRFLPEWPAGFDRNVRDQLKSRRCIPAGRATSRSPSRRDVLRQAIRRRATSVCRLPAGRSSASIRPTRRSDLLLPEGAALGRPSLFWLPGSTRRGRSSASQRSILLTHHNPIGAKGDTDQALLDQILKASQSLYGFEFWYWGTRARWCAFRALSGLPGKSVPWSMRWTRGSAVRPGASRRRRKWNYCRVDGDAVAGDPEEPRRAKNGFVLLALDSAAKKLEEIFFDESCEKKSDATF